MGLGNWDDSLDRLSGGLREVCCADTMYGQRRLRRLSWEGVDGELKIGCRRLSGADE
tara:strand:+ start:331 stop:501 length:171 start_codon:yes stop_codon:yes gene_type:complete